MDSYLLQNLANTIIGSIQDQDVTRYAELMDRNSCSLIVHYDNKGDPTTQSLTNLKPPVLPRTMSGFLAAVEAAKDRPPGGNPNEQYPPPMPPIGYYNNMSQVSHTVEGKIPIPNVAHSVPRVPTVSNLSSPRGAMNTNAPACSLIPTSKSKTTTLNGSTCLTPNNCLLSKSPNSSPHHLRTIQNQIAANNKAAKEAAVEWISELNSFLPLCKGSIDVSEQTLHIFDWLQKGRNIAEPKVYTEVRKPRKGASLLSENQGQFRDRMSKSGSSSITPGTRHPTLTAGEIQDELVTTTVTETTTMTMDDAKDTSDINKKISNQTPGQRLCTDQLASDDRQYHSVVVVIYGRPNFLLQDECYFREDGKIILIDRFCLQPTDPLSPLYLEERTSLFRLQKGKTDNEWSRSSCTAPVLDYSFLGLTCALDVLRVNPNTGKQHKPRPIFTPSEPKVKSPTDATSSAMFFEGYWSQNKKSDGQAQRRLVVAKNRKGEEEAYEFVIEPTIKPEIDYNDGEESVAVRKLVQNIRNKYDTESVKLCNNKLTSVHQLKSVFRNLIANYFLTVKWLDLSCNKLESLPDLTTLPLTTLYLHANQFNDWDVIEQRVCVLPGLTSLTIHGNPIAAVSDYRHQAVMRIQRAKNLMIVGPDNGRHQFDNIRTSNQKNPNGGRLQSPSQGKHCNNIMSIMVKPLKTLDFTPISAVDIHTAEIYSQITKGGTLALVPKQGVPVTIPKTSFFSRSMSPVSNVGTIIGSMTSY